MLIETILRDVIKKTQSVFISGSSNKFHFKTKDIDCVNGIEPSTSYELANTIIKKIDILDKLRIKDHNEKNIPQLHKYFNESRFKINLVGNCGEHCIYAFHYLIKYHSLEIFNFYKNIAKNLENKVLISLYQTEQPYDHAFINIYHMMDMAHKTLDKETLSYLQPDSWICDPWADIICRGNDYPNQWKSKMAQWKNENLFVTTTCSAGYSRTKTNRYNSLFSPERPDVLNTISQNAKFDLAKVVVIDEKGNINTFAENGETVPYNISEINNMDLFHMGLRDITKVNLKNINNAFNPPPYSKSLSDITADKLREKARIYSGLTKIALKKRC